jgi:hypothetical protein
MTRTFPRKLIGQPGRFSVPFTALSFSKTPSRGADELNRRREVYLSIYDPCQAAGSILKALRSGSLALLESELERPMEPSGRVLGLAPDRMERLELLEAVRVQMRDALTRMGRGLSDRMEGVEVQLRLLQHLAAGPC